MKTNLSDDISVEENENKIKHLFSFKNILIAVLLLIFLNILYLDIIILQGSGFKTIEKIISAPVVSQNNTNDCDSNCVDKKINGAILSLNKTGVLPTITPVPTKTPVVSSNQTSTGVKEYYVPFGSGSGSSSDWEDVAGLQAYVDSSAYSNVKQVVFEASLHIPTGNETASVRLYDATDGHPVWNSEVDFNGNTQSVLLTSQPVSLDSGNKLYKVQMMTQLQYQAFLDQSRLHITTQ